MGMKELVASMRKRGRLDRQHFLDRGSDRLQRIDRASREGTREDVAKLVLFLAGETLRTAPVLSS
jgi:hypothetical protein